MPACLRLVYVTAIPIPRIPNAKKPGTSFSTVAPQDVVVYRSLDEFEALTTSSETGPIKLTPTIIDTKPPIKFAIILIYFYKVND
jgi:hypothetical protein